MLSSKLSLGNILVNSGQITRPQLAAALLRQRDSGRRIGEELICAGHATRHQVEDGLQAQRKLVACALAVTLGLAPLSPSAEAAQKSASLAVSATVIANAKLQPISQAMQLKITAADIERGYIVVPSASRFTVHTNSPSGYVMQFHPVGNLFDTVQVDGLGNAAHLGADGGAIVQRSSEPHTYTHELNFRFMLRPDVLPGIYPWPLQLSVRAL